MKPKRYENTDPTDWQAEYDGSGGPKTENLRPIDSQMEVPDKNLEDLYRLGDLAMSGNIVLGQE